MSDRGWIGVDFDGTLAEYDHWRGADHVGAPIPAMVERVKRWLADGKNVRIFTARVYSPSYAECGSIVEWTQRLNETINARRLIDAFCRQQFGRVLPITCTKDYQMYELWDDRAVQVIPNTGKRADGKQ
jgi:hypothetical protein